MELGFWIPILSRISDSSSCIPGHDPFNQNSDRSDREKWSTSKGGPVFSKLFLLDRTDPLSFGLKFLEILVEWIAAPDSTCKIFRDSGFHEQQLHGFRNPLIPANGARSCVNKPYTIPEHSSERGSKLNLSLYFVHTQNHNYHKTLT